MPRFPEFFKDDKIAFTGLQAENLIEAMRMGWQIRQHRDGTVFFWNLIIDRAGLQTTSISVAPFSWP